jgi:hypothetical protein
MPDVAVMVPDLEIGKQVSNIYVSKNKCGGSPESNIHDDGYNIDTAILLVYYEYITSIFQVHY